MTARDASALVAALRRGETAVWLRPEGRPRADAEPLREGELDGARDRFARFAPVLAALFPGEGWDGRIRSGLQPFPPAAGEPPLWVKADHALPMTGSVKARGGVYELLRRIEAWAASDGLVTAGGDLAPLTDAARRAPLARRRVVTASTGNLGFSIGLVARAFGVGAEVHMSHDAKRWKKDRLRALGATVVEHAADYTEAVARARRAAASTGAAFIDDEDSRDLFVGYACAGEEAAAQLAAAGVAPTPERPLVVYLPCGVGGAPGGVTAGLKRIYGEALTAVWVEPVASPCMLAALAAGGGAPVSIYDLGLDNRTVADGLAVAAASPLVLRAAAGLVDAVAAVRDADMLDWTREAWRRGGLRLEPSAASGFAAVDAFRAARADAGRPVPQDATHLVWTTGGALLPDAEFKALLRLRGGERGAA